MKSKCFLAAVMVACLCLNACSTPGKNSDSRSEAVSSTAETSAASTSSESFEATKNVLIGTNGPNGRCTFYAMDIPLSWNLEGDDRITLNEQMFVYIGISDELCDDAYLNKADCLKGMRYCAVNEFECDLADITEIELLGIAAIRYPSKVVLFDKFGKDIETDGMRYDISIGRREIYFELAPHPDIDFENLCLQFERCLASLQVVDIVKKITTDETPVTSMYPEITETLKTTKNAVFSLTANRKRIVTPSEDESEYYKGIRLHTFSMDIPNGWELDGDKLICGGETIAQLKAFKYDDDAWNDGNGDDVDMAYYDNGHCALLDWLIFSQHHFSDKGDDSSVTRSSLQIETPDGKFALGIRYYIQFYPEAIMCIDLIPNSKVALQALCVEVEACIPSLKMVE
ncbi:MAG TPA: hypothetical protein DCE08_04470 [Ruminococcaceae bacterium]|mgnify:CR=1 FL=1|nr:hypothetical protein [Oscillospiraceae bacterium]